jgi:two-component system chemotaxis response regulator CheB
MPIGNKIKVLVVDDSAIVRAILREALLADPNIGTVLTAPDAYIAYRKIMTEHPDVLTLDLEMPGMDGLTFLRKLMQSHPMPVVVISSLTQSNSLPTLEALRLGAVEVLPKPGGPYSVGELKQRLAAIVCTAATARPRMDGAPTPPAVASRSARFSPSSVIAIGASTGGVRAIEEVLCGLPTNCPGIVIVQHIPAAFSGSFAQRLDQVCPIRVKQAADCDRVEPGLALVAPGDHHLLLRRSASGGYVVRLWDGPPVCFQRPSVDVLFSSVAEAGGANAIGVLLTGMGTDGANGLLEIRRAGGQTLVQDQASCVIFGMPKEAIRKGAACQVISLNRIAAAIQSHADHLVSSV